MFIPAGKLIVALIWAFWMLGVESSLGDQHQQKLNPTLQKIINDDEEKQPLHERVDCKTVLYKFGHDCQD